MFRDYGCASDNMRGVFMVDEMGGGGGVGVVDVSTTGPDGPL